MQQAAFLPTKRPAEFLEQLDKIDIVATLKSNNIEDKDTKLLSIDLKYQLNKFQQPSMAKEPIIPSQPKSPASRPRFSP